MHQLRSSNVGHKEEFYNASESLLVAIAEDDVEKLLVAIDQVGKSKVPTLKFEHNMNVLNLAIDQEAVLCV